MKKFMALAVLCAVLCMAGCKDNSADSVQDTQQTAQETADANETADTKETEQAQTAQSGDTDSAASVLTSELAADTESVLCEFTGGLPSILTVGQLADITAVYETHENAVVISKNLVRSDGDRKYVFILDENDSKREVEIVTGIENATEVEIVSGLNAGDKVVVR